MVAAFQRRSCSVNVLAAHLRDLLCWLRNTPLNKRRGVESALRTRDGTGRSSERTTVFGWAPGGPTTPCFQAAHWRAPRRCAPRCSNSAAPQRGLTCPCSSVHRVIAHVTSSACHTRSRRGLGSSGPIWRSLGLRVRACVRVVGVVS